MATNMLSIFPELDEDEIDLIGYCMARYTRNWKLYTRPPLNQTIMFMNRTTVIKAVQSWYEVGPLPSEQRLLDKLRKDYEG